MWIWVVGGLVVWVLLAFALAVVVGRGIRIADARPVDPLTAPEPLTAQRLRAPRRRVPLPPVGIGLAATAVLLETVGYVGRLTGATGPVARALSMDAPFSAPRTFVAALFAVAAVAAVAGAARVPDRRTWWLAVAVLAVLAVVSRDDRRDRRRVLACLAGYAGASVGLSAVSAVAVGQWAVTATYLEESGEALAGVAVLVAVLVGVAPRLVLPASWVLRRAEDAETLAVPRPVRDRVSG